MNKYILLIVLLLPSICNAANGNFLLEGCTVDVNYKGDTMPNSIDAMKQGYCSGLVSGIINTAQLYDNKLFCVKEKCGYDEAKKIVINYLNKHPSQLHEEAFPLAISAFKEAFPCE